MQKRAQCVHKGQGAIEYLLIIGVAILIIAVVIIAVIGILGQGQNQKDDSLNLAGSSYKGIYDIIDTMHNAVKLKILLNVGTNEIKVPSDMSAGDIFFSAPPEGTILKNLPCPVATSTFTSGAWAPTIDSCNVPGGSTIIVDVPNNGSEANVAFTLPNEGVPELIFFSGGKGTIEDPFKISTINQLQNIDRALGKNFILENDIDASSKVDFIPIGARSGVPFTGTFDGNNKKIYRLTINQINVDSALNGLVPVKVTNLGLFSKLGAAGPNRAQIHDLKIEDVKIYVIPDDDFLAAAAQPSSGGANSGILSGQADLANVSFSNIVITRGEINYTFMSTINPGYTDVSSVGCLFGKNSRATEGNTCVSQDVKVTLVKIDTLNSGEPVIHPTQINNCKTVSIVRTSGLNPIGFQTNCVSSNDS